MMNAIILLLLVMMLIVNLFTYLTLADKCIFKIHGAEPKGPNLDNGSWWRC